MGLLAAQGPAALAQPEERGPRIRGPTGRALALDGELKNRENLLAERVFQDRPGVVKTETGCSDEIALATRLVNSQAVMKATGGVL